MSLKLTVVISNFREERNLGIVVRSIETALATQRVAQATNVGRCPSPVPRITGSRMPDLSGRRPCNDPCFRARVLA